MKLSKMILTDEPDMKVLIFCVAIMNSKREDMWYRLTFPVNVYFLSLIYDQLIANSTG